MGWLVGWLVVDGGIRAEQRLGLGFMWIVGLVVVVSIKAVRWVGDKLSRSCREIHTWSISSQHDPQLEKEPFPNRADWSIFQLPIWRIPQPSLQDSK